MYTKGYYKNTFLKLLEIGHKYEKIASEKIALKYNVEIIFFNNNYKFDFLTNEGVKYEVKADFMALKTNNFFIEFAEGLGTNKKLSGISTTEADFYILTDSHDYYLIDTTALKNICKNLNILLTRETKTAGYILPRKDLILNSEKLE